MCATWLWWMCCLPGPVEALDGRGPCRLMTKSISGSVYQAGDVVIGGLFPVHVRAPEPEVKFQWKQVNSSCTTFNQRAYRWLQTMIFAVEEINQNPVILPGITLGYMAADTCLAESTTLATALTMVTGVEAYLENTECGLAPDVPVIIGDTRNSVSILADTLGVFDIPMVSYLASCLCVNENRRYPNFFRTMSSNMLQAQAMARLLQLLGWTWVGLVSADDDYGRYGIQMLMQELKGTGVCVAYNEVVPKNYPVAAVTRIAETIQMSSARVVLTFIIDQVAKVLIEEVVRQNITDKQWIANDAWAAFATLSVPHNAPSLAGTVGFAISKSDIPGLGTFLNRLKPSLLSSGSDPFIKELWEEMFGCSLNNVPAGRSPCSGKEVIAVGGSLYADVSELRSSYNVYKAVYAVAYAIHDMLACRDGTGPSNTGRCLNVTRLKPSQISYYLGRVNFTMPLGEQLFFDQNGYPPASYDIINWQVTEKGMMQFVNVGHFASSDGQFYLDMKNMVWGGGRREERPVSACSATCPSGTRKAFQKGMPECCFDCLPCADGKISNQTGSAECIRCPERFWSSPDRTTCIPQQVDFLSYSDAMGIVLAIISVAGAMLTAATFITFFFYQHTPLVRANNSEVSFMLLISLKFCFLCALAFIGRPMAWSCMLRHTLFGISFVLCISCLLSRTVVVLVAFHSTLPGGKVMHYVGPAQQRLGISICTLVQVLICGFWLVLAPPKAAERGVRGTKGPRIIIECAMGSVVGFSLVLGYIGLLASLCLLLAFLARKLPDNFNEAKHITFSMLIFCAVWVAFVPSFISSPGKYAVAVEIFAILASSYGLLLCIFAPKCFIILLRPERNTKKHMMAR